MQSDLLPHQQLAVAWMRARESTADGDNDAGEAAGPDARVGGGVLADDMGLGKTVDCIALASASAHDAAAWAARDPTARNAATLVVLPLCLLDQWRRQIGRHGPAGSRVLVYHGQRRREALARFFSETERPEGPDATDRDGTDGRAPVFVLTTYEVLAGERARGAGAPLHAIEWYRVVLDEAHRIRTIGAGASCHAAAVALRARRRWCVTGTPYNNSRRDLCALARFIGIAPYDSSSWWESLADARQDDDDEDDGTGDRREGEKEKDVARDGTRKGAGAYGHARLVASRACAGLAEWIDRFVLMRRKADVLGDTLPPCTSRIVRVHMDARERAFYQALLRAAVRAYAAFVAAGRGDPARPRMFGAVLAWVARLRQACDHPLLAMGRRSVRLCLGAFASRERARAGDASWHATCEPDDENDGGDEAGDDADARCRCCARPVRGGPVLRHRAVLWAKASCGHLLCGVCAGAAAPSPRDALSDGVRASEDEGNGAPGGAIPLGRLPYEGACPPCVALRRWAADPAFHGPDDKGTEEEEKDATADDPKRGVATVPTSAKMRALVAYCRKALGADATSRIVVFSQWTACLDVAEALLRSVGIGCVRYDGDLNGVARRSAVLAAFSPSCSPAPSSSPPPPPPRAVPAQRPSTMRLRSARVVGTPPETRVLLASLHCAGVGLDLSAANHVVLLDAWYNPFIEQQACDRVHRIGQTRPVTVVRLHAAGTVETDVHRIQQRKLKEARAMGLAGAVAPPRCSAPADALPATGAGDDACEPDAPLRTDETDGSEADIHEIFRRVLRRCRVTVRKRRRTDGDGDDDRQERREEQHDQGTPRCRDGRKRPRADRDPLSAEDR